MEGLIIGLAMVYPYVLSGSGMDVSNIFKIPVIMPAAGDYTSSVIPVICAIAFAAWFERLYKKFIPDTIKLFAVPLITCLVTVCLTFWIIGPITSVLSNALSAVFTAVNEFSPILMGLLVGFFWQILVMFGLHWALVPLAMINMTNGGDVILAAMLGTTFAQTGACIGIMIKTKNQKLKSLAPPAIISGIAGVTEPAIYGLTLPKKAPFFRTCAIAGVGGAVICATGCKAYSMAGMGIFAYTSLINTETGDMSKMFIGIVVTLVCLVAGLICELIFYKDEAPAKNEQKAVGAAEGSDKDIAAPIKGTAVALSEIKDEAFASEAMGKGIAIEPSEGKVYAPVDGEISTFFPTGHAIGITSTGGAEILIHVGMDTVDMNGEGFTPKKEQGAKIKKGDLLLEFDIEKIKAAGHPVTTPIVITNSDDYADVIPTASGDVAVGDKLIQLM
jgi:PTS system beta-glucosides-specific IIC component